MPEQGRLGRSWRHDRLGVDEASRRRGVMPEHENPLFNYIAGTVMPADYRRDEPKALNRRRLVWIVFGIMVFIWFIFLFIESPV